MEEVGNKSSNLKNSKISKPNNYSNKEVPKSSNSPVAPAPRKSIPKEYISKPKSPVQPVSKKPQVQYDKYLDLGYFHRKKEKKQGKPFISPVSQKPELRKPEPTKPKIEEKKEPEEPETKKETEDKLSELKSSKENKSHKPSLIFLGIFILVLIFGLVLFLVWYLGPHSSNISESDLVRGTFLDLGEGKKAKFSIDGEDHEVLVDSVYTYSVDLTISSQPFTINLRVGESRKLDLDLDNYYDLKIGLKSIDGDIPNLYLRAIDEFICIEDWTCGNWSICVNGTQTRNCTDRNNCGTEESRPPEGRYCIESTSEQNQTINGTLDCGSDWSCFINASKNCTSASLMQYSSLDIFGVFINSTTYLEIRKPENESNKCNLYTETIDISVGYTDELIEIFMEEFNLTFSEIQEAEAEVNESAQEISVGLWVNCSYDSDKISAILNASKYGIANCSFNISLSSPNYYTTECYYEPEGQILGVCETSNLEAVNNPIDAWEEGAEGNNESFVPNTILDCYNENLSELLCEPEVALEFTNLFESRLSICETSEGTFALGLEPLVGIFRGYEIQSEQDDKCIVKFWFLENNVVDSSLLNKQMICEYNSSQRTVQDVNDCFPECCSGELVDAINNLAD